MIDYPYILLILFLLLMTFLNARDRRNDIYFYIAAAVVLVFTALRAPVVGADTYNYVRFFTGESINYSGDRREFEPLFTAYNSVMKVLLFRNGVLYMIVNSVLTLLPVYVLVKHNAYNKPMSILLFFLSALGILYFVALRQLLSLAIFVPMRNRWIAIVLIVISIVSGLILKNLDIMKMLSAYESLNFSATERLDVYLDEELVDTSEFSILGILKKSIIGIFAFLWMPRKKVNHWFSKIYLVGVVLSNFFFEMQMVERMVMGFSVFGIICVTWAFGPALHKAEFKLKLVSYAVAAFMCLYMSFGYIRDCINYDPTNDMRMHPYYFFFQDYHDHPSIKYHFN